MSRIILSDDFSIVRGLIPAGTPNQIGASFQELAGLLLCFLKRNPYLPCLLFLSGMDL